MILQAVLEMVFLLWFGIEFRPTIGWPLSQALSQHYLRTSSRWHILGIGHRFCDWVSILACYRRWLLQDQKLLDYDELNLSYYFKLVLHFILYNKLRIVGHVVPCYQTGIRTGKVRHAQTLVISEI